MYWVKARPSASAPYQRYLQREGKQSAGDVRRISLAILTRLKHRAGTTRLLFASDGIRATRQETVSAVVASVCDAMLQAGESNERFELRDLRRTCETMLAAAGVTSDVRAQIQSHGLGGVHHRHYNRHDYLGEKRAALELWERRLTEIAANPVEVGLSSIS